MSSLRNDMVNVAMPLLRANRLERFEIAADALYGLIAEHRADDSLFHPDTRKGHEGEWTFMGVPVLVDRALPSGQFRVVERRSDAELLAEWARQEPTDSGTNPEQDVLAAELERRQIDL